MRVALMLTRFFMAGQTNHVIDLALALDELGHEVTFLGPRTAPKGSGSEAWLHLVRGRGLRIVPAPTGDQAPAWLKGHDIIHAHSSRDFLAAARLSRAASVPLVLTVHGLGVTETSAAAALPRSTAIIAVGPRVAANLKASSLGPATAGTIHVIENGVDTERFHPPEAPVENDSRLVVYAGRIDRGRQDAFRSLAAGVVRAGQGPPVRLEVLAPSLPQFPSALRKAAADVVDFRGWVRDPAPVFRRADIVAGCGRVTREALASGRPTLLVGRAYLGIVDPARLVPSRHDFSGLPPGGYVTGRAHESAWWLRPGNLDIAARRVAADLGLVLTDRSLERRLSVAGRSYALAHLGLDHMTRRTVEVYRRAATLGVRPGMGVP